MKVAVVHYWWLSNRGGEAVITAIISAYPDADIYLHVCDDALVLNTLGPSFKGKVHTTFISKLPGAKKHYQKYLPLMPLALEQLDLTQYDLVISSESGPAKGVITSPDALHVCYCHSPMRYIWDMYYSYIQSASRLVRWLFPPIAHWLRMWDVTSSNRVDTFIANSSFVAKRIKKFYRRDSTIVFPPVNVSEFNYTLPRGDFYLCLGQMVAYKRADLVVEVFNRLKLPLVIIGEGELFEALESTAESNIKLLGRQTFNVVKDHLQRCKALVFPGLEDFGIVPVEAMAAGAPVIAYGKGGVLDTVIHGKTGILFNDQTAEGLQAAILEMERGCYPFNPEALHNHAMKFDKSMFVEKIKDVIQNSQSGELSRQNN